jgi:hypothetical protein
MMAFEPHDSDSDDFDIDDLDDLDDMDDFEEEFDTADFEHEPSPPRHSRAVRWTAILVVASFALAGASSLFRWW